MTFGGFAFGQNYFGQIPLLASTTERPRVGGSPSDVDYYLAKKRLSRRDRDEVDLFALGQALGVIDP